MPDDIASPDRAAQNEGAINVRLHHDECFYTRDVKPERPSVSLFHCRQNVIVS